MIIDVPADIPAAEELGRVHFVGIAGAALSGLARVMVSRGVAVTGSDAADSPLLSDLRALGIVCHVGHAAAHVDGADTVVVSTAVRADNPEVVRGYELGLRVWPRAAAVQSVLRGSRAVVVTGTHGKTTTTSMLVTALQACGADPSYAIGSPLTASGLNAAAGSGEIFVAEGDESDGAILAYTPAGAVVTNVDADHLDHFGTPQAYAAVFDAFLARIDRGGFLVCSADDPGTRRLAAMADEQDLRVVRVGLGDDADLRARAVAVAGLGSTYEVWDRSRRLAAVSLQVPGEIYVVDSLAALAAGIELGYDVSELAAGLARYRGSRRRMELKGETAGIRVFDSYAHHPVEISADLQAARAVAGAGRLVVCYQPHLYSRTRIFGPAMGSALGAADVVVVMDVYAAREVPESGVDGRLVADAVPRDSTEVVFEPDWGAAAGRLVALARPGDLVLTLGAGDVTDVGPQVLGLLGDAVGHAESGVSGGAR